MIPKKFSILALLPGDQRSKTIQAYTEGRRIEKLEKSKKIVEPKRLNQKKGRRPVWIIKAQISQQASRERENDSLNSNP